MRAILLGLLSSAFFSATFIINRAMNVSGTSWAWTASFRFLFALPILFLIVLFRKNLRGLWEELKKHPLAWIGWGSVAGIGFYSLLSFCSCLFSSLARCWNLASYYISRFTTLAIIFR